MAVRITKVYTRTGDRGDTALVGGKRVAKDSLRVEAYGAIDELNSIVGLARVFNEESRDRRRSASIPRRSVVPDTRRAVRPGQRARDAAGIFHAGMYRVGDDEVKRLEKLDGSMSERSRTAQVFRAARRRPHRRLPASVPHGVPARRARYPSAVAQGRNQSALLKYVNRLSDLFFVLARWISKQMGEQEYLWQRGLKVKPKAR